MINIQQLVGQNLVADTLNIEKTKTEIQNDTIPVKQKVHYFTLKRFTALALIVLTGPLGGHRLYLGTEPQVPVFYALTLGGGFFVLPVVDFVAILVTKDLSKFENNNRVIMWLNSSKNNNDYETEDW